MTLIKQARRFVAQGFFFALLCFAISAHAQTVWPPTIRAVATAPYIIKTANPALPNAQALGSLATGIVKNTTSTGVLSIAAAGTDYIVGTGVSGGQTVYGGTANGDILFLRTDSTNTNSQVALRSSTVASAANASWNFFDVTTNATVSGTTHITNTAGFNGVQFRAPHITANDGALTVDYAATVEIAGQPGGNGTGPATITNAYSLWVQGGVSRFDGVISASSALDLSNGGYTWPMIQIGDGTSAGTLVLARPTSSTSASLGTVSFFNGTTEVAKALVIGDGATDSGAYTLYTRPTGGSLTERLRVDSSGNVGIGATPVARLHVESNAATTSIRLKKTTGASSDLTYDFYQGSTLVTQLDINCGASSGQLIIFTKGAGALAEAARFTTTGDFQMADAKNIVVNSTTGTKFATATTQKIAFYNATPIVQPATTGTTTGFTAGSGTGAKSDSTYTGNVGSSAYTVGDIVLALKNLGLMAQ